MKYSVWVEFGQIVVIMRVWVITVITNTVPQFFRMPQLLISDETATVFALIALAASQYGRMVLVW